MSLSFKEARKIYANICNNASSCDKCPLINHDPDSHNCMMGESFINDDYLEDVLLEEKKKHWKSNLERIISMNYGKFSGKELTKFCFYHCPGEYLPYGPKCTAEEKKLYQHNGKCFNCWMKKGWLRSE